MQLLQSLSVKPFVTLMAGLIMLIVAAALPFKQAHAEQADIWLMGEVHDNPHGHAYRLRDLQSALNTNWRPAILMEQFDVQRQPELTAAWQNCTDAQCVIDAAGGQGWDWELYKPLIQTALQLRLPLVAANVSREQLMQLMKQGFEVVFDSQAIAAYRLNQPFAQPWLEQQRTAMRDGHCNMLPERMIDPMVNAQAARDVMFARLISEYASQGVVLIAGNGHVRKDLGVPVWLDPALRARTTVYGYVEPGGSSVDAYDRIRLVSAHPRPDPCEAFKRTRRAP